MPRSIRHSAPTGPLAGPAHPRHLDRRRRSLRLDLARRPRRRGAQGRNARHRRFAARLAPHKHGVPLWWKVTNRNKRGITLDLRKPRRQGAARPPRRGSRRAGRELPHRHARRLGHHPRLAAGDQPAAHDPARHRLRPDRPLPRPSRLRARVRGDERLHPHVRRGGRHAAASRLPDLRRDRRALRRDRHPRRALPREGSTPPRAARRSTAR